MKLAPRPSRLTVALRKLVAADPKLDGVRLEHGVFDEDNVFVLSGIQDHDGQAERLIALARDAAVSAWPELPPPAVKAGAFPNRPLRPFFDNLVRNLPRYEQADHVLLLRAYYDADSALVLSGRTTKEKFDPKPLEALVRTLSGADPRLVIKLLLTFQAVEDDMAERTRVRRRRPGRRQHREFPTRGARPGHPV